MTESIQNLKGRHTGQTCHIVGKGPSLSGLTKEHFGDGPIITLNQAINAVEPLEIPNPIYSMQKDGCKTLVPHKRCAITYRGLAEMTPPTRAALIVSETESKYCMEDYSPRFIFDCEKDFSVQWNTMSVIISIKIAHLMGCSKIVMIAFDGMVRGDIRTFVPGTLGIVQDPNGFDYLKQRVFVKTLAAQLGLSIEFVLPETPIEKRKFSVMIATPFYDIKGYSPYIKALTQTIIILKNADIPVEFMALSGDSYIDNARNKLATLFSESGYSHLLFIDSDMSWDMEGMKNLLLSDEDIVSGSYPVKNNWDKFTGIINIGTNGNITYRSDLISAVAVSTGFCLIKHTVFDKLKETCDVYMGTDLQNRPRMLFDFFGRVVENGQCYSEDYAFCKRWRDVGGSLWIEPRIELAHYGIDGHTGKLSDRLSKDLA